MDSARQHRVECVQFKIDNHFFSYTKKETSHAQSGVTSLLILCGYKVCNLYRNIG